MHPFDELKGYVGFDDTDSARLRALLPFVEPWLQSIAGRFYERVQRFPGAAAVFTSSQQAEAHHTAIVVWLRELLAGPHDRGYYELRKRVGQAHVRANLSPQYMFTGMHVLRCELLRVARENAVGTPEMEASILKITDIDLAIMVGTYIDTHEREQLESLRAVLIARLPITVLVLDGDERIVAGTEHDSRVVMTPAIGKDVCDAVHPAVVKAAALRDRIHRVHETGLEFIMPRLDLSIDGELRSYRVSVLPLEHPMARSLVHIEDLTEAIRSEARAHEADHLAKIGAIASTVAHEVRNPLAGISLTLQVVHRSLPEEDTRRAALARARDQIARLGALVADLLGFARPLSPEKNELVLDAIAESVANDVEAGGYSRPLVSGSGKALGDSGLVSLLLVNLIQNAWQAGARHVCIEVDNGRLLVADDGPGIPPDLAPRVFEPFFTTKVRGTGLGLPNAKRAAESMGGTIRLSSSPLGGAGFEVRLPEVDGSSNPAV